MARILIWRNPIQGSDIDIFHPTDYSCLYDRTKQLYGYTNGINFGNRVWFQGICSAIDRPCNSIAFRKNETADEINDQFDLIIYPMANFFSEQYCRNTEKIAQLFMQIKIPVYIIACGAQADSYDYLDDLITRIGSDAKRFIDAIYHTGGEFALRGFFTQEFFKRLGYSHAVVTGCPSMFQLGPDLKIEKHPQVDRLLINGKIKSFEGIMRSMPESIFVDQDSFLDCLYNPDFFTASSLKRDYSFFLFHSIFQAELLGAGRIKLIPDVSSWYNYLKEGGFDYSFGTKIHGSIMPVLAGIPATVIAIDSRTQEMAEFFDIPFIPFRKKHSYTMEDLQEAWQSADYTHFNSHFSSKYQAFENFLTEHGIVDQINTDNKFFMSAGNKGYDTYQPNKDAFAKYAVRLRKEKTILQLVAKARRLGKLFR